MSVPVWMTEPAAALKDLVAQACLPVDALLELRRLTTTCLSSLLYPMHGENHSATNANDAETAVRGSATSFTRNPTSGDTAATQKNVGAVAARAGKSHRTGARR